VNDYLEIKRHKNKPDQQFHCELLHQEIGYAVLRYVAHKAGLIVDMCIAPGSTTIAHYWHSRPYVVWRMFDSSGQLIGTLFHICTNVCIHDDHLSYDDLLLDIWIAPDGSLRVLDEDELNACVKTGLVTDAELYHIHKSQQNIIAKHIAIIAEITSFDCKPASTIPPAHP
jgi:predicted RNA-binding protein associated with RNAse of E/G family